MHILELHLKNFGKFTDRHIYFQEQIHVIYGENEYGKSTIYAFIKAMLFGLERGRGRAAGRDVFSRYEPWENPNYYAGMMRFCCGGRTFRLERTFDRYTKSVSLVCEDDGEVLSVEAGDLQMLLGGMTAAAFENTAAVGQLTAKPGQELAAELKNYAANYYETGSGEVDLQGAFEQLKLKKKRIEQDEKLYRADVKKRIEELELRERYIDLDISRLKEELAEAERKQKQETGQKNGPGNVKLFAGVLLALGGICGIVSFYGFRSGENPHTGVLVLFMALFAAGILLAGIGIFGKIRRRQKYVFEHLSEQKYAWHVRDEMPDMRRQEWEIARIREEIREKQTQRENIAEQIAEVESSSEKKTEFQRSLRALELAEMKMQEAARDMAQSFGERLNQAASEILNVITEGKYSRLFVDEALNLSVFCEGKVIPAERLSRGSIEQVYFSLRMAALELLYEEELPVVLDDAFVFYDEKRLKSALKWLSEQSRQVIIFSCQTREEQYLSSLRKWKDEIR